MNAVVLWDMLEKYVSIERGERIVKVVKGLRVADEDNGRWHLEWW